MNALTDTLQRLSQVRTLGFESRSAVASGWDGWATALVSVSCPLPGVVVFHETGTWQSAVAGRAAVSFRNVFRWSVHAGLLRLEHLRHGADRPVWLFDMAPAAPDLWKTLQAHQCGQDRYDATLSLSVDHLALDWSIDGPRKRETLGYLYGF